jgi:hypothetical protein
MSFLLYVGHTLDALAMLCPLCSILVVCSHRKFQWPGSVRVTPPTLEPSVHAHTSRAANQEANDLIPRPRGNVHYSVHAHHLSPRHDRIA